MSKPTLALILPCYNEARNLSEIVPRCIQAAKGNGFSPYSFRLVLVNNGSTDDSAGVLSLLKQSDMGNWLEVVTVDKNEGYGHGVLTGLKSAHAMYLAWSHADGQCHPEDVFRCYRAIRTSTSELAMGKRVGRPFSHWLFSRCFDLMVLFVLRRSFYDINAQPKVFPAGLVPHLEGAPKGFAFDLHVLLKARENGYGLKKLPVQFDRRKFGQSSWATGFRSRMKTIRTMLDFIFSYEKGTLHA